MHLGGRPGCGSWRAAGQGRVHVLPPLSSPPALLPARAAWAGAAHPHFVAAAVAIVREEGAGALLNGLPLSLVKIAPQTAVTFAVYEVGSWVGSGG